MAEAQDRAQRADRRILVVDDHVEMARLLADQLGDEGYQVEVATGGAEALERAQRRLPDVVLTDLRMEKVDGFDLLAGIKQIDPGLPVLIMTAFGGIDNAVEAIKRGAFHYLTKPFQLTEVLLYIERALVDRQLREENRALRRLTGRAYGPMVGQSPPMRALYEMVAMVAHADAPVFVHGESGSGKELVARALHEQGPRRTRPFVAVNCTALPEQLLESELFGHVKGAFTGATTPRRGLFVEADGGTLLLDEIGDMALGLQAKLLRVIETQEVRSVGADAPRRVDVRLVAATHQDLDQKVREGSFRADLYYRLNVVPVSVPPLRQRTEDIPLLIEHLLGRARERNPRSRVQRFSAEVIAAMASLPWPGNVRELENVVTRLVVVCPRDVVEMADLAAHVPAAAQDAGPLLEARQKLVPLRQLEREYITWVLAQCGGNKTRAAEILKIDVSTIHRNLGKDAGR